MTEEDFVHKFRELIDDLNENYIRGLLINGDISKIDRLCFRYLAKKAELYKRMRIKNPLNGAD